MHMLKDPSTAFGMTVGMSLYGRITFICVYLRLSVAYTLLSSAKLRVLCGSKKPLLRRSYSKGAIAPLYCYCFVFSVLFVVIFFIDRSIAEWGNLKHAFLGKLQILGNSFPCLLHI